MSHEVTFSNTTYFISIVTQSLLRLFVEMLSSYSKRARNQGHNVEGIIKIIYLLLQLSLLLIPTNLRMYTHGRLLFLRSN